jgi:nitrogen-specific signal transduction histidine kinase/CheY-like chemotaxis protein
VLKRTQEEALARQKLESLGVLAGGIAHDFNNLLGGILAEAELIEADLAADLSPSEEVARIKSVAIRGAEIVRQLMIYAGQDLASLSEPVDLSHLVEEMLELLRVSVCKQVVLKIDLHPKLPAVLGNAPQIRQVVMNLVINASEAINEKEGSIHVSTSHVTLGQGSTLDNTSNLPPGDYVQLEVSDTGCGMSEEARAKIFDPFYTTKFAGRGMGLAVVQGIVREQGGAVHVVSAPGDGATFLVLLPCASTNALNANSATSSRVGQSNETGNITVLVVEDEEVLRQAISKSLRHKRFTVLEARDGSAAINLVGAHEHRIDVLLLDVTLPGRSSREVFEEAQRMRPDLKIILTSAYGKERALTGFNGLGVELFIRKPFQLAELVNLIQVVCQREEANRRMTPEVDC